MFNTEEMTIAQSAEDRKPRTITGYLIDVQNETHGPCTIEKSLRGYYEIIGCCLISMTEHQIGVTRGRFHGKRFTIICDDEALFVDQPKISAIDNLGQPMLCGANSPSPIPCSISANTPDILTKSPPFRRAF